MNEKDRIRLEHIIESIENIESFLSDISRDEFLQNKLIQSAVVRQFEIIGEAANSITTETQNFNQSIPWRIIRNFRNVLIHEYFGVDYNEVYTVYTDELEDLKKKINVLLK